MIPIASVTTHEDLRKIRRLSEVKQKHSIKAENLATNYHELEGTSLRKQPFPHS